MRRLLLSAVALSLIMAGPVAAAPIPLDDAFFKAITPGPDESGNGSLPAAGAAWEAANVGWNTSTAYDDSAWGAMLNDYWVPGAVSPMYLRYEFSLGTPTFGMIFGGFQDDDAQMWVNGTLVYSDTDGNAGGIPPIDILPYLVVGDNLIAWKVHDTFGGGEGFNLSGLVDSNPVVAPVPEPATSALMAAGLAAVAIVRRRTRR